MLFIMLGVQINTQATPSSDELNYKTYQLNETTQNQPNWPNLDLQPITQTGTLKDLNATILTTENTIQISGYIQLTDTKHYTINTQASGKMLLWIDDDPIINTNSNKNAQGTYTKKLGTGWHRITIDYIPDATYYLEIEIDNQPLMAHQIQTHLKGLYYEKFYDAQIKATYGSAVAGLPDFNTLATLPDKRTTGIQNDIKIWQTEDSAVRYIGYMPIHKGGNYTFNLKTENKSLIYINDKIIADVTQITFTQTQGIAQGTIKLEPGYHKIEIETYLPLNTQVKPITITYNGPDTDDKDQKPQTNTMHPNIPAAILICGENIQATTIQTNPTCETPIIQTYIYLPQTGSYTFRPTSGSITLETLEQTDSILDINNLTKGWYKMTIHSIKPNTNFNLQIEANGNPTGYLTSAIFPSTTVDYVKPLTENQSTENITCDQIYNDTIPLQNYIHKTYVQTNFDHTRWRDQTNYKLCLKGHIYPQQNNVTLQPIGLAPTDNLQITPQPQTPTTQEIPLPQNQKHQLTLDYTAKTEQNGLAIHHKIETIDKGRIPTTMLQPSTDLNQPPQIILKTATTREDTPITLNANEIATDPDGDPITITRTTITQGEGNVTITDNGTKLTYQPKENFNGTVKIEYTVTDGQATTIDTITITVTPEDDAPTFTGPTEYQITLKEIFDKKDQLPIALTPAVQAQDIEGNEITYRIIAGNEQNIFAIDPNTGIITVTKIPINAPDMDWNFEITIEADDGTNKITTTITIAIDPIDDTWCKDLQQIETGNLCYTGYVAIENPDKEDIFKIEWENYQEIFVANNNAFDFRVLQGWQQNRNGTQTTYIPGQIQQMCQADQHDIEIACNVLPEGEIPDENDKVCTGDINTEITCINRRVHDEALFTIIGYFDIDNPGKYQLTAFMDDAGEIFLDNKKVLPLKLTEEGIVMLDTNVVNTEVTLTQGEHRIVAMVLEVQGGWAIDSIELKLLSCDDPNDTNCTSQIGTTQQLHTILK